MIQFNCASCGKAFTVPDEAAGRTGKCNKCGHKNQVPAAAPPAKAAAKISTNAPAKVAPAIKKAVTSARPVVQPPEPRYSQSAPPIPAAQTVPQSVVPQTIVVVQQEKKRGNSLAIASVIVAVLAFAFCWIPLLGILSIPVGLIALLLGGFGLLISLFRRGAGIGFSIAGVLLSVLSIVVAFTITTAVTKSVAEVGRIVDNQSALRNATNQQVIQPMATPAVVPNEPAEDANVEPTALTEAKGEPATPHKPAEPEWANAQYPVQQGDVRVSLNGVKVDFATVKSFRGTSNSENKLLLIPLTIDNLSDAKKLDFRGFSGDDFSLGDSKAHQEDNFGNRYRQITFGIATPIEGQAKSESIYPSKSVNDLLVFEVPVEKIEYLHLELPATAFGGKGKLRFEISRSAIAW